MPVKATLTPETCNMEPETIITDLAMGFGFPALDYKNLDLKYFFGAISPPAQWIWCSGISHKY